MQLRCQFFYHLYRRMEMDKNYADCECAAALMKLWIRVENWAEIDVEVTIDLWPLVEMQMH